jgi:RHS repeat-associated protein
MKNQELTNNTTGNIARMVTTITDPNTRHVYPLGNAYRYDQLNRLKESRSFNNLDPSTNAWGSGGSEMYYNAFEYDANGNITNQTRSDENNNEIDRMTYYYTDMDNNLDSKYDNSDMKLKRNRLSYVRDQVDYDNNDIDPEMPTNNYQYDEEGRLVSDSQEEISKITWRVDGKVKKIERTQGSAEKNVSFDYDAMGHRIAKHVYTSANVWEKSIYYVLDAQGNVMSVYEHAKDDANQVITYAQTEKHIYGSARLGTNIEHIPMFQSQNLSYSMKLVSHHIGERTYELSNHLGNVLSVISDKVIPHQNGGYIDYWLADLRHAQDYSPFGVTLNGRDLSLSTTGNKPYRYGFQNQEEDAETGLVNFEYRMHDPRIGRFFSIDLLAAKYAYNSPYAFSENCVINAVELEGLEQVKTFYYERKTNTYIHTPNYDYIDNSLKVNVNRYTIWDKEGKQIITEEYVPWGQKYGIRNTNGKVTWDQLFIYRYPAQVNIYKDDGEPADYNSAPFEAVEITVSGKVKMGTFKFEYGFEISEKGGDEGGSMNTKCINNTSITPGNASIGVEAGIEVKGIVQSGILDYKGLVIENSIESKFGPYSIGASESSHGEQSVSFGFGVEEEIPIYNLTEPFKITIRRQ